MGYSQKITNLNRDNDHHPMNMGPIGPPMAAWASRAARLRIVGFPEHITSCWDASGQLVFLMGSRGISTDFNGGKIIPSSHHPIIPSSHPEKCDHPIIFGPWSWDGPGSGHDSREESLQIQLDHPKWINWAHHFYGHVQ